MTPADPASPSPAPTRSLRCPLCGGPNACAAASTGSFDAPCWCRDATFTSELLARVPPAERGRSGICCACAEGTAVDAPTDARTYAFKADGEC